MLIKSKNRQQEIAQSKSYLVDAGTAGQTVFELKNTNGFEDDLVMQVGETGQERSEIFLINGTPGTAFATAVTGAKYSHPADAPVYCYRYNQVVFMSSSTGTAGTAAPITNGTINVAPDALFTVFDDTAAVAGYAWKTKFRNSALASESPESDWVEYSGDIGGYKAYSLAGMRKRIRDKIASNNITDDMINDWINEWRQEMTNAALSVSEDYVMGTVDVGFSGTANEATITVEDFVKPRRVWFTDDGIEFRRATFTPYNKPLPDETFSSDLPVYSFRGDNVIVRYPADISGTARIAYDSIGVSLSNDGDKLPLSMRGYSKSFIDYGIAQAYRHPSINYKEEAGKLENQSFALKEMFIGNISPRQRTNTEYIDIVEGDGIMQGMGEW